MMKLTEANVPSELILKVRYVSRLRSNADHTLPLWMTFAYLKNPQTNETIASGQAECSEKDIPNRKIGRAIAVGRALKEYYSE